MSLNKVLREILDGYKLVDKNATRKASKGMEYIDLWEGDPKLDKFVINRIQHFTDIESKLNEVVKLLREAKQETIEYYKTDPDFKILYSTDLIKDYLDDLIKLLK